MSRETYCNTRGEGEVRKRICKIEGHLSEGHSSWGSLKTALKKKGGPLKRFSSCLEPAQRTGSSLHQQHTGNATGVQANLMGNAHTLQRGCLGCCWSGWGSYKENWR